MADRRLRALWETRNPISRSTDVPDGAGNDIEVIDRRFR
jgi:hypothetical protein